MPLQALLFFDFQERKVSIEYPFRPNVPEFMGDDVEGTFRKKILSSKQDIAILYVDTPFEINEFTGPACLPKKLPDLKLSCYISGYGLKSEDDELGSDLMTAPMKMIDNKTVESKCKTTISFAYHNMD